MNQFQIVVPIGAQGAATQQAIDDHQGSIDCELRRVLESTEEIGDGHAFERCNFTVLVFWHERLRQDKVMHEDDLVM